MPTQAYNPPSPLETRWVSWPNSTASSIAPTATTANTRIPMVPAPASTAGIVKTPVPTMLPTTSPVAEVNPKARTLASLRGERGSGDVETPFGSGTIAGFMWLTLAPV
jgi:hypothetical protein